MLASEFRSISFHSIPKITTNMFVSFETRCQCQTHEHNKSEKITVSDGDCFSTLFSSAISRRIPFRWINYSWLCSHANECFNRKSEPIQMKCGRKQCNNMRALSFQNHCDSKKEKTNKMKSEINADNLPLNESEKAERNFSYFSLCCCRHHSRHRHLVWLCQFQRWKNKIKKALSENEFFARLLFDCIGFFYIYCHISFHKWPKMDLITTAAASSHCVSWARTIESIKNHFTRRAFPAKHLHKLAYTLMHSRVRLAVGSHLIPHRIS